MIRKIAYGLGVLIVAILGGALGWFLAPASTAQLGPLEMNISVRPSLEPGSSVQVPPFGEIVFATHEVPIAITATLQNVDLDAAQSLISSSEQLRALEDEATEIVVGAVTRALAWSVGFTIMGAAGGALLVYHKKWRSIVASASCAAVILVGIGGGTAASFNAQALGEPQFNGLLSKAPYIAQAGQSAVERLESYRSGLADIVKSVSTLYTVADTLPVLPGNENITTVLHVSDMHLNPLGFDLAKQLVKQFNVDMIIDTGDITSWGTDLESAVLGQVGEMGVPYVFVGGNHDSPTTAKAVAAMENSIVLNNEVTTVSGLTIAGIADPRFLPDDSSGGGSGFTVGKAAVKSSTEVLAKTIMANDKEKPETPVDIALVHDASRSSSLLGKVPLVLSGHTHTRKVTVDENSGTRIMVEGSTGGAVITSTGMKTVATGDPTPLEASLLYFAKDGAKKGKLLAYDQVTVGGLGLASVNLQRTIVGSKSDLAPESPADVTSPSTTESSTPSDTPEPPTGETVPENTLPPGRSPDDETENTTPPDGSGTENSP